MDSSPPEPARQPPPGYAENQGYIAVVMGRLMLLHFRRIFDAFDGDLMLAMVLAEIGQHNIEALMKVKRQAGVDYEQFLATAPRRGLNTLSLSQACGIPRETLRRKVDKLIKLGWMQKLPDGNLVHTERCIAHFGPEFNLALLRDLMAASDDIRAVLSDHAP
jgi:hypothetical protein